MFAKAVVTNQHELGPTGAQSVEDEKKNKKIGKKKKKQQKKENGHKPAKENGTKPAAGKGGNGILIDADVVVEIEKDLADPEDNPATIPRIQESPIPAACGDESTKPRDESTGHNAKSPDSGDESSDSVDELSTSGHKSSTNHRRRNPRFPVAPKCCNCCSKNLCTIDCALRLLGLLLRSFQVIFSRLLFMLHAFLTVWRTADILGARYWFLLLGLLALLVETVVKLVTKQGVEGKWFCPSVFLYLCTVVPAIWLLELDRLAKQRMPQVNVTTSTTNTNQTIGLSTIEGIEIPIAMSRDMWVLAIEQTLLFLLIIGRWMLPKGNITRDQLSQLLFVYIGIASDISEIFVLFEEQFVIDRPALIYITLAAWSLSLMQYTLVLTATKSRKTRVAHMAEEVDVESGATNAPPRGGCGKHWTCCEKETWAILTTILLQDGPFLSIRLYVIIAGKSLTYTILFYTFKNTLVLVLQIYRLVVINLDSKHENNEDSNGQEENGPSSSGGKTKNHEETTSNKRKPPKKPHEKRSTGDGASTTEDTKLDNSTTKRRKSKVKPTQVSPEED